MPSNTEITASQLIRLVGLPNAPAIIDLRTQEDFEADARASRRPLSAVAR